MAKLHVLDGPKGMCRKLSCALLRRCVPTMYTQHAALDQPFSVLTSAPHGVFVLQAKQSYEAFVQAAREAYVADRVKDGVFGAMMDVSLVNDGPVTCGSIILHVDCSPGATAV